MIDNIDNSSIRWFIRRLHDEYEQNSIIRDWCDIDLYYDESIRTSPSSTLGMDELDENEFIQIGQWTKLPTDVIHSSPQNEHLITSMVRRIILGERNFIIEQLDDIPNNSLIRYTEGDLSFEEFEKASRQVNQADTLILPLTDDFQSMRQKWNNSDQYYFWADEFLITNNQKIDVYWYPTEKNENIEGYGYLFNSSDISLVQKWQGDSTDPSFSYDEEYNKYSLNRPLMMYFGEEVFVDDEEDNESLQEKVDFLYRAVLSKPKIEPNSVLQLRP